MSKIADYTLRLSDYIFLSSEDDFLITIEFYNSHFIFRKKFRWYEDNLFLEYQHPITRLKLDSIVISDSRLICSFISQVRSYLERFERDLTFKYQDTRDTYSLLLNSK